MKPIWHNRIVGRGEMPADQFLAHPLNYRLHPRNQQDATEGSLNELGWIRDVLVSKRSGRILDGHLRVTLALRRGDRTPVPYTEVDLDETEEALALAVIDPLAALAGTDTAQLDALLREVSTSDAALQAMLDSLAQDVGIVPAVVAGNGGDDFDTTPDAGPTRCQAGDLWLIDGGRHRLICGDSADAATVGRLMDGERLRLIVTDPPYGVSYADKNAWLNVAGKGNHVQTPIENDHGTVADIAERVWKPAFAAMYDVADRGCSLYCFMPQGGDQMMMMMMMMMSSKWPPRHELIWLKNNHVLGRADYNYKHEPIVYAWKDQGHKFYGGFQTSVLEFDKPQKSDLHPTTKPLDLIARLVMNSSAPNELVGDWFLGSGTTLIAAHRTGRRCYGIEIEPRYADVVLRRAEAEGLSVEHAA